MANTGGDTGDSQFEYVRYTYVVFEYVYVLEVEPLVGAVRLVNSVGPEEDFRAPCSQTDF